MTGMAAAPADAGSAPDPVDLIQGLLTREDAPPRSAADQTATKPRGLGAVPEPDQEPETPEPGPEVPPVEGDDVEDDEEQPEEQPEEPELFAVKIDGKEEKVTREELLRGYQRQSDYSRNMNQLAEQKRQAEAAHQQIQTERNAYISQLDAVATVLQASLPAPPDESLLHSDPITFMQQKELYEGRARQLQGILGEKQRAEQQTQYEMQQRIQQSLASAREQLLDAMPEWRQPDKARAGQREVADYLRTVGYADHEIAQAADPRAIVMARKAMLYDKLQASRPTIQQKLATAPKMVKPGSAGPAPDQKKALTHKVRSSGGKDMDAIARLIELG